jgi:predicted Zn-dependent protease
MGHTFGLVHCARSGCAMSLSTNIRQVDAKGLALCADCGLMLREAIMKTNREAAA